MIYKIKIHNGANVIELPFDCKNKFTESITDLICVINAASDDNVFTHNTPDKTHLFPAPFLKNSFITYDKYELD